jgi:hypothetical protein
LRRDARGGVEVGREELGGGQRPGGHGAMIRWARTRRGDRARSLPPRARRRRWCGKRWLQWDEGTKPLTQMGEGFLGWWLGAVKQ